MKCSLTKIKDTFTHWSTFFSCALLTVLVLPRFVSADGDVFEVSLQNPLKTDNIPDLLVAILNIIIAIAVPIIIIFIVLAGFKYVMARGNAQQAQEATRALTYAVVGGLIIIGAIAITEIVRNIVAAF